VPLNFPDYVPLGLVDTVGFAIGVIVTLAVLYEFVRWRGVLSPIGKGFKLGAGRWATIFVDTIVKDVVYQQISPKCPDRKWASHSLVFWGFILLMLSTTTNWLTNPTGGPLPLTNPVRLLGNLGGVMLLVGLLAALYRIGANADKRETTFGPDYLFMATLLIAGVTGFLTEFVSEWNFTEWMYGVYALHLLGSAALLLLAPFTKFIHAFGRSVIRLSERYLEALSQAGLLRPAELASMPLLIEEGS